MEELKMVLSVLSGVAEGATELTKWWLILHYGTKVLIIMAWFCVGFTAVFFLGKALLLNNRADSCAREIARLVGVHGFDTWYHPDRERLYNAVAALSTASKPKA